MLRKLIISTSLLSLIFLGACAATIIKPIKDENKAASGEFDGVWRITQKALSARQSVGSELFSCKFYNSTSIIVVQNGVGKMRYGKYRGKSNISKKGGFYIEMPTEHKFKSKIGTDSAKNGITYVFKGFLAKDASKGLFTIGKESLNNSGCSTKLTIVPTG